MSTSDGPADPVGLDIGAGRVHGVRLVRGSGALVVADCYAGSVSEALVDFCAGAAPPGRVAVDAPGGPSAGAHAGDLSVAPKFRSGRCSEIPVPGVPAVSWVTPPDGEAAPGWMLTGFEVWRLLSAAGAEVVETFPAAVFHRLNGGRWPPRKSTPEGRRARVELLRRHLDMPADADRWPHDLLDAAAAALVAATGVAVPHHCGNPDGSRLWLTPLPPG